MSRREGHDEEEGEMSAKLVMLSELVPHWVHDVVKSYEGDEWAQHVLNQHKAGTTLDSHLTVHKGG